MRSDTYVMPHRPGEPRRAWVRRFMHQPWFELALLVLILVSCVVVIRQVNIVNPTDGQQRFFQLVDGVFSGLFLGELGLRCWTYRNRSRFFARYWLDIIASVPLPVPSPLRLLRLARLLRLLRVGTQVRRRYLAGSGGEFVVIFAIAGVVVLVAASVMAEFEKATGLAPNFDQAFWWSILSMVSNQPADHVPATFAGRIVSVIVVMTGLCLFAIVTGTAAAVMSQRLRRLEDHSMDLEEVEDHIIICGWDRRAPLVLEELQHSADERHRAIVVIAELEELPPLNWKIVDREKVYLLTGDFTKAEILEKAGIRRAAKAIIMSEKAGNRSDQDRDARTILAALTIEKLNRNIYTCAELLNREHEAHLRMAGVEDVVCASEYGATLMSSMAIHSGISTIIAELLSVQYGNEFFKLDCPPWLEGKSFGEAVGTLTKKESILIAVERPGPGKHREITLNPTGHFIMQRGDKMVVISRVRPDISVP